MSKTFSDDLDGEKEKDKSLHGTTRESNVVQITGTPPSTTAEPNVVQVTDTPPSTTRESNVVQISGTPPSTTAEPNVVQITDTPHSTTAEPNVVQVTDTPHSTTAEPNVAQVTDTPPSTTPMDQPPAAVLEQTGVMLMNQTRHFIYNFLSNKLKLDQDDQERISEADICDWGMTKTLVKLIATKFKGIVDAMSEDKELKDCIGKMVLKKPSQVVKDFASIVDYVIRNREMSWEAIGVLVYFLYMVAVKIFEEKMLKECIKIISEKTLPFITSVGGWKNILSSNNVNLAVMTAASLGLGAFFTFYFTSD